MVAKAKIALAAIGVCVFLVGCSSDDTIENIKEIENQDPMRFTAQGLEQEKEIQNASRASLSLNTGFMVSCWKSFATVSQQTVMDNYTVNIVPGYTESTPSTWDYTTVPGQIERYWDLSSYPYRFHAIAPVPSDKSNYKLGEIDSNTGKITVSIPSQYVSQTCSNGVLSEGKEPFTFAQVGRDPQGKDMDIIANKEINFSTSPTPLMRTVAMPFHHLTSKVRFAIYTTDLWATSVNLPITNVTVKITSSDFVTKAGKYEFSATDITSILYSLEGFKEKTTENNYSLLKYSGEGKTDNNLGECTNKATAFFFDCKDGMLQIPQKGVEMKVSFTVNYDGSTYKTFTDIPVKLVINNEDPENPVIQDKYTWDPGYIYTYYLIIEDLGKMDISFTASLIPWVDVVGSTATDLEK